MFNSVKTIQWGKNSLFNKCQQETGYPHTKKNKVGLLLTLYTKINSKWIIDLKVRAETIKQLEENIDVNLCDLGVGKALLDMTPDVQATKRNQINWTLAKLKTLCVKDYKEREKTIYRMCKLLIHIEQGTCIYKGQYIQKTFTT